MRTTEIHNCHIHTFTTAHTPRYFPHPLAVVFRYAPWLIVAARYLAELFGREHLADRLKRIELFHRTGSRRSQREVLREALFYYPPSTKFVVLPLDLGLIGHGPVEKDIGAQHDELAELARDPDYGPRVIPFATIYPDRPGAFDEFRRCIEEHGFKGLKLYPKTGFRPDHPMLMDEVYPYCVDRGLPVMTHCSRGGVYARGWTQRQLDRVTEPLAYDRVLRDHPALRLCLAHFGGSDDWRDQLRRGFDPDDPDQRERNWAWKIADLLKQRSYENLYTDISYTMFRFEEFVPLLRLHLADEKLRERVLFGSDFYMTRQEKLSEKEVSIRLRDALGEETFHQIAEVNPRRWLGL